MASKPAFDLTLYLVTDENPAYLCEKELVQTVDDAIKGGATIVQYRQKHGEQYEKIQTARKLLEVTRKHKVPLLINDDIETCLAVGADGVHIGQDDMSLTEARKKIGNTAIIGVTASSVSEAKDAITGGADYLGIGTMFKTPTKTDTKSIIGTRGTQAILEACETGTQHRVPCVAIGSINSNNVQRVLHQSASANNRLNGVAVVSAIMASDSPEAAARQLRSLIDSASTVFYPSTTPGEPVISEVTELLQVVPAIIAKHASSKILCHNMTNTVVQNFVANVCLATGSSPIMSLNGQEADDLAQLQGTLVINMGTMTDASLEAYLMAVKAYNTVGSPVLLDPVGGGATSVRKEAVKTLMAGGFFDIIKGNEGEITAVMGTADVRQHGVDSGASSTDSKQKADMAKELALREHCVVLLTGATDYLSDGTRTYAISNGSHWLGKITGSGCALGAVIAGYVGVHKQDKLLAALAGIMHYEIAAERAAKRSDVNGPGTFIPGFLDELYAVGQYVEGMGLEHLARVEKMG